MSGRRRVWRRLRGPLAAVCAAVAVFNLAAPGPSRAPADSGTESQPLLSPQADRRPLIPKGRDVFQAACSTCHGANAQGVPGAGPSLHGVGEIAADFYLRTNRMPLQEPRDEPTRLHHSPLSLDQKRELVAYVGSFGGPKAPFVNPRSGRLGRGQHLFAMNCAGCHQIVARGGQLPGAVIPDLESSKAIDVAEAMSIGPYVMSNFRSLGSTDVNSIIKYVEYAHHPKDSGGWGIGHIGPIPEGMVTFWLGLFALVLTTRIIGERTTE